MNETTYTPQPQPVEVAEKEQKPVIGLPASQSVGERRFPLTPEAVAVLIENGYRVKMEENAGKTIQYTDLQYIKAGAEIASRKETFGCDIVIYLPEITTGEIRSMRTGATLMSLLHAGKESAPVVKDLLKRNIVYLAIDLMADADGNRPFADILAEVDGRAMVALASAKLISPEGGKGILMGGVSGIVPCEVTVIGSGIDARAAALSAIGLGAMVRMFDNDIYGLRKAVQEIGPALITSAMHPKVLRHALHSADVVIVTRTDRPYTFTPDDMNSMKKGVILMDTTRERSYGNSVPRTAAMAMSNTFIALLDETRHCGGIINCVKLKRGIQQSAITFFGKLVNHRVAKEAGMRAIDINILLNCS